MSSNTCHQPGCKNITMSHEDPNYCPYHFRRHQEIKKRKRENEPPLCRNYVEGKCDNIIEDPEWYAQHLECPECYQKRRSVVEQRQEIAASSDPNYPFCPKCATTKPVNQFRDKKNTDKIYIHCITCRLPGQRADEKRQNDPHRKANAKARASDPTYLEKRRQRRAAKKLSQAPK